MTDIDQPTSPRPVAHGPNWATEGFDEGPSGHPILEGVRWDLTFECTIGVWHEAELNGVPEHYSISVSAETDTGSVEVNRSVTPDQIREFARHLLAVVGDQP